jgi:indolepyruvate ferredoxin oxidoreductase beta subunit
LVKGYSDTHERGLKNYHIVMDAAARLSGRPDLADVIRQLRNAALADDQGVKLGQALEQISAEPRTTAAA